MREVITKGIVVKSTDYKDSDKLVTIFSADLGLIHARSRGVKKNNAKLSFASQTFAFVEFVLIESGSFFTIKNATSIDQFFQITSDFDNYVLMLASLELVEKTVKENDVQPKLFLLLLNSFKLVCYENVSAMVVFIKFMLGAMELLGFKIELDHCLKCGESLKSSTCFSYDFNGLICLKCANKTEHLELSMGEVAILKNINSTNFENLKNLKFASRNNLVSVISLLCKIFRIQTDQELISIKKFL